MPGLVPGIHVLQRSSKEDVDGRDKPGHDELAMHFQVLRNQRKHRLHFRSDSEE
jgi:hypothetical protein